jgi:uncharacterized membrane protein
LTRLERSIGTVLRAGVIVSSGCLGLGLVLSLIHVAPAVSGFLLQAGLLTLIATPAARVVISIVEYTATREWPFVLLTTIVFIELLASAGAALLFNRRL